MASNSDQLTSLPIRSEKDGADQRVHIKIVDFAAPDTTDNQSEVSEKLLHVRIFGNDPAATKVQVKLSELGNVNPAGFYDVDDNSLPASVGVVAGSRDATPGVTKQTVQITSIQDSGGTVRAMDVSLHDEDGEPFSASNPLAVYNTDDPGAEVIDYKDSGDVAKNSTDNHDYSVTALKTLTMYKVMASASGLAKFQVLVETAPASGTFNAIATAFNSTANPNVEFDFQKVGKNIAAGVKVRIACTNKEVSGAQSMYSTICGVER